MAQNQNDQNQNQESNINAKDFIIGALVGGIVGAATALFMAPKSGKELRGDLSEQAIILKERTGNLRDTAVQKGNEFANTAKEKTNEWSQMIQLQSNELKNKMKSMRNEEVAEEDAEAEVAVSNSNEEMEQKLEETKKAFEEVEGNYKA
ncbi:YtxH domain-containing protein [Bacillus carboniphilus]|uniref:YtxH domain-containing protein n=1 Tax=Bacillus carboniphilus TaxID=86663 RepID=A0ABN0WCK4_9BACI